MRKLPAAALVSALTLVGCTIPPETDTPRPTETVWVTPAPQPHPTELPPPRIPSVQAAVDRVLAQYGGEAEVAVFDGVQTCLALDDQHLLILEVDGLLAARRQAIKVAYIKVVFE